MKLRRMVSCLMALLLVCGLPLSAFAEEYDLSVGSVTVNATDDGNGGTTQTVSQVNGVQNHTETTPTVIKQSDSSTSNTVTINAAENTTANVTIQDVNIVISDPAGSTQNHSGDAAVTIDVADKASANVTLDGVNIDTRNTGSVSQNQYGDPVYNSGEAAVQITGNGDVTLELDGDNTLWSGINRAGMEKNTTDSSGKGNLTITDETGKDGSLKATGGHGGAGIGGGEDGIGSNITITGNAEVTATGGHGGAGIGGGNWGDGSKITITGSAEVTAKGGSDGSGIGGGFYRSGSHITIAGNANVDATGGIGASGIGGGGGSSGSYISISGSAEVTANGGSGASGIGGGGGSRGSGSNIEISGSAEVTAKGDIGGAGIGGGRHSTGSDITISEDAQVKAQGGKGSDYAGEGAAIGDGGARNQDGQKVTPNTNDLNEGWIATYAPGTENMNTATPDSLTYKDVNGNIATNSNAQAIGKQKPTCTEDGHEAGFSVDGAVVAVTIPATGHSMGDFYTTKEATCQEVGVERRDCADCDYYETSPLDKLEHSFTNYISDGNATYDHDGTRTAQCDHGCGLTDTIPDPGSRLPYYLVKGQDGRILPSRGERQDGVLTITADADFAILTGALSGMRALKSQGIDTIVFVTNGATSTFALADLLASMTAGDSYALTHDGEAVTFTLSSGEDISKILK